MKINSFWIRCTFCFFVIAALGFGAARLYYAVTDDFHLGNIIRDHASNDRWDIRTLSQGEMEVLLALMSQEFHYLGKGAQSYALESSDGQYVLKFFKSKHIRPSWVWNFLPEIPILTPYKEAKRRRKEKRLHSIFNGYKLAYELHRAEAGLVYVHLNPTKGVFKEITLTDKMGFRHTLSLDSVAFIVQKKVVKTREVLQQLLLRGEVKQAKMRIGKLFDLYVSEYGKGIYDRDHGVLHNTGFAGETPIHLDVGKLSEDRGMQDPQVYREDLKWVVEKFDTWLGENYPKYYPEMASDMEGRLSEILGETVVLSEWVPTAQ